MKVLLIKTDQTIEEKEVDFNQSNYLGTIEKMINAKCLDIRTLHRFDSDLKGIMYVDDTGVIDKKPVNMLASIYYNTGYEICGDVVLTSLGMGEDGPCSVSVRRPLIDFFEYAKTKI